MKVLTAAEAADRVKAGMQMIADAGETQRLGMIDVRALDIKDFSRCMAGQMDDTAFSIFETVAGCDARKLVAGGFDVAPDEFTAQSYDALTQAWKAALG